MAIAISYRQKEIIEASARILMNGGIKALTTKNLAQEMGFTEGAIYRHFKNKNDIIQLLVSYISEDIQKRLSKIFNESKPAEDNIKQIFKSQFQFFNKNPHFIVVITSEGIIDETEGIYKTIGKIIAYKSGLLTQIVELGKINGEFRTDIETQDLVHILLATFRLEIMKWKFFNSNFDLEIDGNRKINAALLLMKK